MSSARPRYYRLDGHEAIPCEVLEWAEAFEGNRRVADEVVNGLRVSTVFLGIDHNFSDQGPPLIFETMVFDGSDGDDTYRCSTWDEAVAQHVSVMAIVKMNTNNHIKIIPNERTTD